MYGSLNSHIAPISPKGTFYFSNGTGRDAYIFNNNGGLSIPKEAKKHPTSTGIY
jgi:hypothetical protein